MTGTTVPIGALSILAPAVVIGTFKVKPRPSSVCGVETILNWFMDSDASESFAPPIVPEQPKTRKIGMSSMYAESWLGIPLD